jgi:hypothetical protein
MNPMNNNGEVPNANWRNEVTLASRTKFVSQL